MNLLMPFWDLAMLPRYMPQFTALAENVDRLTVLYTDGTPPTDTKLRFHQVEPPSGLNKQHQMHRLMETIHTQLDDISYDAVYCLSGRWLQIAATTISKETDTPLILRLRGDEERVARYQTRKTIRDIFFKRGIHESFKQASLIIPIAEKLYNVARRHKVPASKITPPIPNGVDHTKFQPAPQPEITTIGYVGRISPEKGSDFLHKLIQSTPETHYNLAGPIQYSFNPPPNCDHIGPVPYSQIQEVYKASSIIIIPSLIEGDPNARLEAYASARPIIITPGAHPQEAKLHGWKLDHNIDSWIHVIRHLRRKRLKRIGREAHEYSKKFTWELHGKRMGAAIKTIGDAST